MQMICISNILSIQKRIYASICICIYSIYMQSIFTHLSVSAYIYMHICTKIQPGATIHSVSKQIWPQTLEPSEQLDNAGVDGIALGQIPRMESGGYRPIGALVFTSNGKWMLIFPQYGGILIQHFNKHIPLIIPLENVHELLSTARIRYHHSVLTNGSLIS